MPSGTSRVWHMVMGVFTVRAVEQNGRNKGEPELSLCCLCLGAALGLKERMPTT